MKPRFATPLLGSILCFLGCAASTFASSNVRISEFLALNSSGIVDENGERSDWIEIHNISGRALDLEGWSLTDNEGDPDQWIIPQRLLLADKRLVIFASGKDRSPSNPSENLHTNFKLSGSGEYLGLFEPDGTTATEFSPAYPSQLPDISYGYDYPANNAMGVFYDTPTPNSPEQTGDSGLISETRFEVQRGFFDAPFIETVSCSTPGASLIYTTDGSRPTLQNGVRIEAPDAFTGPTFTLSISETTTLRVLAYKSGLLPNDVPTHTYVFLDQVLQQDGSNLPPHASWGDLNQPDWEMDPEIVNDISWGPTLVEDLKALPTLSVVMNWADLFGNAPIGIYDEGESDPRSCSVEYFVADGSETDFQINATVQIQGGGSTERWRVDKLSMRLKFDSEFDSRNMAYTLFPESPVREFETLILAAGHNLVWQSRTVNQSSRTGIVREQLVGDLQLQMAGIGATHHARHVHLYLNGLYWGLFALQERPDEAFAAAYLGGDKDDYTVMKHDSSTVVSGSSSDYAALLTQTRKNQAISSNYEATQEILDVPWLIDYMILNHWAGSYDWAHHNWYASFNHNDPSGLWRFHSWDMEHVFYDLDHMVMDENDTTQVFNTRSRDDTGSPVEIHYNLLANADYRIALADHIQKRLRNNGTLNTTNALRRFEERVNEIDQAVNTEAARWGDTNEKSNGSKYTKGDWLDEINWLRNTYFPQRTDIVIQQYIDKGWYPEEGEVTFSPYSSNLLDDDSIRIDTDDEHTIYLTTDGSDPRTADGDIATSALVHPSGGSVTLTQRTLLKARSKSPSGDWGPLLEATYQIGDVVPASVENLALSEFHYNPSDPSASELANTFVTSNNDFEFIEILNTLDDQAVDLSMLTFTDGIEFQFPEASLLAPGARAIIVSSEQAFNLRNDPRNPTPLILGSYSGQLSNGGERLILSTQNGVPIFDIDYEDSAPWPESADGDGYSLLTGAETTDPSNGAAWQSSYAVNGTPGFNDTMTYQEWATANAVTEGPSVDSDLDTLTNLAEYYFGTDPHFPTSLESVSYAEVKSFSSQGERDDYLSIVYYRSLLTDDARATLEFSRDLENWSPLPDPQLVESVENLGNGFEEVQVRSTFPLSEAPAPQYIRIRIED